MTHQPALVIVTSSFPISGDGSEAAGIFVADLAEELAKHVPVRVVARGAPMPATVDGRCRSLSLCRPGAGTVHAQPWHPADAMRVLRVLHAGHAPANRR